MGNQFHYKKYKERDQSIKKTFVFIFHHTSEHGASAYTFIRKKSICQGKCSVQSIQVTGSTYCEIVFQTKYTSKIRT